MNTPLQGNPRLRRILALIGMILLVGCGTSGEGDEGIDDDGAAAPVELFVTDVNSERVVFLARGDETSTKLSAPLVDGGNVVDFAVSPDGDFVAYLADQEQKGLFELFTVPVDGGKVINISRFSGIDAQVLDVVNFAWAPDNSRVAFLAFNPVNLQDELFTNLPDGRRPTKVSIDLDKPNGNVTQFEWAPDSSLIAYIADAFVNEKFELFTTFPDSPQNFNPSGAIPAFSSGVNAFFWSPDSELVAFIADISILGVNELFVSPSDQTVPSPNPVSGSMILKGGVTEAVWEPVNSTRIAFIADKNIDEQFELFSVKPDATGLENISDPNIAGSVRSFSWAPDGTRIAYLADQETFDIVELFTSTPEGARNIKISADLDDGEDVKAFQWAPDSSRIAYKANQDEVNINELYTSRPSDPIENLKVSATPMAGGLRIFNAFRWAPNSSKIAYVAAQATPTTDELHTTIPEPDLSDPDDLMLVGITVSGPLVSGGNVEDFRWSDDSGTIAYLADQDTLNVFELFSSKPDGSENRKISGDLLPGGQVIEQFEWVP